MKDVLGYERVIFFFFFFSLRLERYLNGSVRICLRINKHSHMSIEGENNKMLIVALVGWNYGGFIFFLWFSRCPISCLYYFRQIPWQGLRFCSWVWPALEPASLFALLMSVHKALGAFTKSQ